MEAPSLHELLRARFAQVRRSLDEAMKSLDDGMLEWAPAAGMRTIGGLLFEIAGKEAELLAFAKAKGREEWQEVDSFGEGEKTVAGWAGILGDLRRDTLAYLDSLTASDLDELVLFADDWWEGLYLRAIPMHEIFRSIAAHEWYHTGQLVTYIWQCGRNPYESA